MRKILLRVGLPLLILAVGAAITVALVKTAPEPVTQPPRDEGVLVETLRVQPGSHRIRIDANGTVVPSRTVSLEPQVSGRVVWRHPALEQGGRVAAGEALVKLDRAEFELAVEQAKTEVTQAQSELALERSRRRVAQREWDLFGKDLPKGADKSLVLREPQLKAARAALEAARSRLERAELDLKRTTVEAPFDAYVLSSTVEQGARVGPQVALATLAAADPIRVSAAVPASELDDGRLPGPDGQGGAKARIEQELGAETIEREGRVVRIGRALEDGGRLARVLIDLFPPEETNQPPLLFDSWVDVFLEGDLLDRVYELPARALRGGRSVWLFDEGRLEIAPVRVAWRDDRNVLVSEGLSPGALVVTSEIPAPVEGMKLRTTAPAGPPAGRRP